MSEELEKRLAEEFNKKLETFDVEFLKMDGFDDCVVGVVNRFGQEPILCYDCDKVLAKLKDQGMSLEDAVEYFDYNMIGAWVGDRTPCFITTI